MLHHQSTNITLKALLPPPLPWQLLTSNFHSGVAMVIATKDAKIIEVVDSFCNFDLLEFGIC